MLATPNEQPQQQQQHPFLRAAADIDSGRLVNFDIADRALLRAAARLVARKLFDAPPPPPPPPAHSSSSIIAHDCIITDAPWRVWRALGHAVDAHCVFSFSPWDVLHRCVELGGGGGAGSSEVDARCRLILLGLGHAVRCDFDSPQHLLHDDNDDDDEAVAPSSSASAAKAAKAAKAAAESPLHFALRCCGPRTVEALGVHFAARLAPHEDVANTLANAHPDMLRVLRLRYFDTNHNPVLYGRIASRPDGGTLLHAVCANPLATEQHIRLVLRPFESQEVRLLDDKLRTARDLLLLRRLNCDGGDGGGGGGGGDTLDAVIEHMEYLERIGHKADLLCAKTTLLVMRRKGLPRELALRVAKQRLRVAA